MPSDRATRLAADWRRHICSGEWERAWRIGDRVLRGRSGRPAWHLPRHLQPVWDGRPLAGQRVLVRCYHGLGDTVQFIRFARRLERVAAAVIVWAQAPLLPLLRTAPGVDRLMALHDGGPRVKADVDIEIMELPHALRLEPADLPGEVPYLGPRERDRDRDRDRRREPLRVGLVWHSGDWDATRTLPLRLAERLVERAPHLSWHVMQRGPALGEWRLPQARIPAIGGIGAEAHALRKLDLLISVDTLSAHLAGALAVPTWTLLPARADWRWALAEDRTPWYPTMRLYRQQPDEDWEPLIDRVSAALDTWAHDAWDTRRLAALDAWARARPVQCTGEPRPLTGPAPPDASRGGR